MADRSVHTHLAGRREARHDAGRRQLDLLAQGARAGRPGVELIGERDNRRQTHSVALREGGNPRPRLVFCLAGSRLEMSRSQLRLIPDQHRSAPGTSRRRIAHPAVAPWRSSSALCCRNRIMALADSASPRMPARARARPATASRLAAVLPSAAKIATAPAASGSSAALSMDSSAAQTSRNEASPSARQAVRRPSPASSSAPTSSGSRAGTTRYPLPTRSAAIVPLFPDLLCCRSCNGHAARASPAPSRWDDRKE